MKEWTKYTCLAFVFLNLFSAGLNFAIGGGLLIILVNLAVAGICWYAYVNSE